MAVKKDAIFQLTKLCHEMLCFSFPYLATEKNIEEKNLADYDLIVKLVLLAWNTAVVKPSLSAVRKTLEMINLHAFNRHIMTGMILDMAADMAWKNSRSCMEYFAYAEVSIDNGKLEFQIFQEYEADGKGIGFEEFRKTMKKDNSGRSMAKLLEERFGIYAEMAKALDPDEKPDYPVYYDEIDFKETFYKTLSNMSPSESEGDDYFISETVDILTELIWAANNLSMKYEDVAECLPRVYRKNFFQVSAQKIESVLVFPFCLAIGIELLYGHSDTLDDWEHLAEMTIPYIPEEYRGMADGILDKMVKEKKLFLSR